MHQKERIKLDRTNLVVALAVEDRIVLVGLNGLVEPAINLLDKNIQSVSDDVRRLVLQVGGQLVGVLLKELEVGLDDESGGGDAEDGVVELVLLVLDVLKGSLDLGDDSQDGSGDGGGVVVVEVVALVDLVGGVLDLLGQVHVANLDLEQVRDGGETFGLEGLDVLVEGGHGAREGVDLVNDLTGAAASRLLRGWGWSRGWSSDSSGSQGGNESSRGELHCKRVDLGRQEQVVSRLMGTIEGDTPRFK